MAGKECIRARLPDEASGLAARYFNLAIAMARRFRREDRRDRDEYESGACWGLLIAAGLWESPRGIAFSRLARYWITSCLFDVLKRRTRQRTRAWAGESIDSGSVVDSHAQDPGLALERAEEINRMLAFLPPRHAIVFRLVCLECRDTAYAAEAIGVTRPYVRQLVREARACFAA